MTSRYNHSQDSLSTLHFLLELLVVLLLFLSSLVLLLIDVRDGSLLIFSGVVFVEVVYNLLYFAVGISIVLLLLHSIVVKCKSG